MVKEELKFNEQAFSGNQEDYDAIREAINKLSTTSQDQFETIKKEKWYNRLFDMVTFSQKGKKRLAEQIETVAQAQQILIELLLRLSNIDSNISEIVAESMDDIRRIQGQNQYLLSRINELENAALGIKADMDINRLSDKNKRVLSACLYLLNSENGDASAEQKNYANSVISYLCIDTQMDNPTRALAGMDNDSKRQILSCCMEYLFLKNCSPDSYENNSSFIDEFDFGDKTVNEIKQQIISLYKLRGCEGFYSKYQMGNYENFSDEFDVDFEEVADIEKSPEPDMTDETITSILHIMPGEVKTFQHKNIHIRAFINCEGTLELDHCILYYNETPAGDEITLAEGASLRIKDSKVICKGLDQQFLVTGKGSNTAAFDNTTFIDCSFFIQGLFDSFILTNCVLHNCFCEFISIKKSNQSSFVCNIADNAIVQDELSNFNCKSHFALNIIFGINCGNEKDTRADFNNNTIIEKPLFREKFPNVDLTYLYSANSGVKNCTFIGITGSIYSSCIENSKFEGCSYGIRIYKSMRKMGIGPMIENCVFSNCKDVIQYGSDTHIMNCQFISCCNPIIEPLSSGNFTMEFCQFINTKDSNQCINRSCVSIVYDRDSSNEMKESFIKKCIFDGAEIHKNYLVGAYGSKKISSYLASINDCDFRNCTTNCTGGQIIKDKIQCTGLFGIEYESDAIEIHDCRGLDNINKGKSEADTYTLKTTSDDGEPIGASPEGNIKNTADEFFSLWKTMVRQNGNQESVTLESLKSL